MNRITVVLAEMPRMLRNLVRAVLEPEPDVALRSTNVPSEQLSSVSELEQADIVIVAEKEESRDDYAELLYKHPRLRLVAIDYSGASAFLYELRPHRSPLGEMSPEALRTAVRQRHEPWRRV